MKESTSKLAVMEPTLTINHLLTGRAVKGARLKKAFTAVAFANRLEISTSYLCDLEAGRRAWTPDLIERATKILR